VPLLPQRQQAVEQAHQLQPLACGRANALEGVQRSVAGGVQPPIAILRAGLVLQSCKVGMHPCGRANPALHQLTGTSSYL
jgi:hypothetical protein